MFAEVRGDWRDAVNFVQIVSAVFENKYRKDVQVRDYLRDSQETLQCPRPLRDLLAEDRAALLGALVNFLGNSDIYKRKYAAFCLGQIGDASVLPALKAAYDREEGGGAKEAMAASLTCLKKMPASSGSTETQRCEFVEEVYKGNLPDEVKNFWKEGGAGHAAAHRGTETGKQAVGTPSVAKASSGGCLTLAMGGLVLLAVAVALVAHF